MSKERNVFRASAILSAKEATLLSEYSKIDYEKPEIVPINDFITGWALQNTSFHSVNQFELAKKEGYKFVAII